MRSASRAAIGRSEEEVRPDRPLFRPARRGALDVSSADYEQARTTGATVVDVRTASEFTRGHVPSALNLDVNRLDFPEKAATLDKSKVVLVSWHAGLRGARAAARPPQGRILIPPWFIGDFFLPGRRWTASVRSAVKKQIPISPICFPSPPVSW